MSKLSTTPIINCIYCGRRLVVQHLSTSQPDPDGSKLLELFRSLAKNAMCDTCAGHYNFLAKEGRSKEMRWER